MAETPQGPNTTVRTAVVIVHGMGEQLPLETLNRFVRTALPKVDGDRRYFSRPERVTDSYEARRLLAYRQPWVGEPRHGHVEFFEYHWSYKMTGNKLMDLLPTFARLLFRSPRTVPYGLKRVWWIAWVALVLIAAILVGTAIAGVKYEEWTLAGVLGALFGEGVVVAALVAVGNKLGNTVTSSFVDVVRYLDRSPRSYEVRRQIRKGMVDLLQGLHDRHAYSRIVVVAHSLGGYIAYDAITWLWPEMCKLHSGPIRRDGYERLPGLKSLQDSARAIAEHPASDLTDGQQQQLAEFREQQFKLWRTSRQQGNPWLVTDLVTVGTPMYFADLLYTKDRKAFEDLVKRSELPMCPPRAGNQMVEGRDKLVGRAYGFNNKGREVLTHGAPFAVVRWTNLFFPAEKSWHGDWFGGPLRPLFGTGIRDMPVSGNTPGRRAPGLAHSRYFSYPDDDGPDDIATILGQILQLNTDHLLDDLLGSPEPLPETDRHPTTRGG